MENTLFLKVYSSYEIYQKSHKLLMPIESMITLSIFKFCSPEKIKLIFVHDENSTGDHELVLYYDDHKVNCIAKEQTPWQVASCVLPVVIFEDLVITGLCAVARHISKYRTLPCNVQEHEDGLLGFRQGCLQAPNETSIWTKFCEVDIITTGKEVLTSNKIEIMPTNLIRFENHLNKPVRVHNVFKVARNMKKEIIMKNLKDNEYTTDKKEVNSIRTAKNRKWKSNLKKELEINSSTRIEDLELTHQYAEGPFFTLADLILYPTYHAIIKTYGDHIFKSFLPLTLKWYQSVSAVPELDPVVKVLSTLVNKPISIQKVTLPMTEDVSLYKSDPKRHNPKRRLFTKDEDIEAALSTLMDGMELSISPNKFKFDDLNWATVPDGANPTAGHLPDERKVRKARQLENLTLAVLSVAKKGELIVDFCSGSGHLGILIAHLLPKCTVILLENKEQSLLRARKRVHDMGLKNVHFFQCNLDFFIGKFELGIALHACGIASDLVLDKCLKANAKFVLCPCCYGSVHATDRLVYPRSCIFSPVSIDKYLCIGHAADQTHEDHPLTVRGARCMAVIDSDRGRLAEEFGYKVTLSKLKPLSCTPKNNLLIGIPA